jgi:hypothetical protein
MSKLALTRAKPIDHPHNILDREEKTYEEHKQDLLRDSEGQYVLIKGSDIIGVFPTHDEAFVKAYDFYPKSPFFVKQIMRQEEPVVIPSNFGIYE